MLQSEGAHAHAKKHPASFQGTLGFFGLEGLTMKNLRCQDQNPIEILGFQGSVSCGGFLVAEPRGGVLCLGVFWLGFLSGGAFWVDFLQFFLQS